MGHFRKNMISVFLTNQCNLACSYCYLGEKPGQRRTVNIEFAKRGIDDFFRGNPEPAVRFFAQGEPTLAFDEMVQLRDYAAEISGGRAIFELQTNGVFSEATARWISGNVDIVYISIDGLPNHQDFLRKTAGGQGTSDVILRNIQILQENPKLQLGARVTITAANSRSQMEMIDYFHALGIRIVFSDMVFSEVGSADNPLAVDPTDFVDHFVEARQHAESLGVFYGTVLAVNFDERVSYACRACLPTPHLTVDGYVTCCDMCVSGDSPLQDLIYGKYDEASGTIVYNPAAMEKIRSRHVDNLPACQDCEVRDYCAGACLGEALNETGDFYGVKEESCRAIRYLWEKLDRRPIPLPYLHP